MTSSSFVSPLDCLTSFLGISLSRAVSSFGLPVYSSIHSRRITNVPKLAITAESYISEAGGSRRKYPRCAECLITYPLGGGYVLFYTLFLTPLPSLSLSRALSLSLSLSLSLCHFLPSFWNNSATVREGVTKFEMPRQKLLKKCLFLFIAPFDL